MTPEHIIRAAAREFRVSRRELISGGRRWPAVAARQAAMWALRYATPLSHEQIGELFAGRHHSTVVHAVQAAAHRARHDAGYALRVAALLEEEHGTLHS